jgi:hypothetical protein
LWLKVQPRGIDHGFFGWCFRTDDGKLFLKRKSRMAAKKSTDFVNETKRLFEVLEEKRGNMLESQRAFRNARREFREAEKALRDFQFGWFKPTPLLDTLDEK